MYPKPALIYFQLTFFHMFLLSSLVCSSEFVMVTTGGRVFATGQLVTHQWRHMLFSLITSEETFPVFQYPYFHTIYYLACKNIHFVCPNAKYGM